MKNLVHRCADTKKTLQALLQRTGRRPVNYYPTYTYTAIAMAVKLLVEARGLPDESAYAVVADAFPMPSNHIENPFRVYDRGTSSQDMCAYRLQFWSSDRRKLRITAPRMHRSLRELNQLYVRFEQVPAGVNGQVMDICDYIETFLVSERI